MDELIAHSQADITPFLPFKEGKNVDEYRSALILSAANALSADLNEFKQLYVARMTYLGKLTHSRSAAVQTAAREEFERLVVDLGATMMQGRLLRSPGETASLAKFYFGMNCIIGFGVPDQLKRYNGMPENATVSIEERTWGVLFVLRALDFYVARDPRLAPLHQPVQQMVIQQIGPNREDQQERRANLLRSFEDAVQRKDELVVRPLKHCTDVFRLVVDNPEPRAVPALRQAWLIGLGGAQKIWS